MKIDFSPGTVFSKGIGVNLSASDYSSPEQLRGGDPDQRSDVFAAGCILYELLGDHPPFEGFQRAHPLARRGRGAVLELLGRDW